MIVKVKTLFFDWILIEQTENIILLNNLIPTEHKKFFSENMHTFKENFSFFLSNHPFYFLIFVFFVPELFSVQRRITPREIKG